MYLRVFPIAGFHKNPIMCYTGVLHQTENSPKYIVISRKKCTADVKWYICKNSKYNLKYGFLLKKTLFCYNNFRFKTIRINLHIFSIMTYVDKCKVSFI